MPIDAAAAADHNLLKALGIWAAAAEEGQLEQEDGCTLVRCAAPLSSFNQILVIRRPTDVAAVVARATQYFRGVGGRFRLRIRDDVEPIQDEPFLAARLVRCGGIPSLSAQAIAARTAAPIDIRAVTDEETLAHHVDVVASSFEWWRPELARVFRSSLLEAPGWRAYVGYLHDRPVTTAQLVVADDVAGLYYVGSVEDARGRGYGEAITRHAMAAAESLGCSTTTLQASPMGLPIYERIGFARASYYRTFVPDGT